MAAITKTKVTVMAPADVSTARTRACTSSTDWATIRIRRLGNRSAKSPPKSEKSNVGANRTVMTAPSRTDDSVRSSTNQARATSAIHVPTRLSSCPTQNRR